MAAQLHPQRVPIGEFQSPSGGTVPVRGSKEFLRQWSDLQARIDLLAETADVAALSAALDALAAVVASTDADIQAQIDALEAAVSLVSSGAASTDLAFEAKMRAIAQSAAYLLPAPDSEHSFVLNRVFRA